MEKFKPCLPVFVGDTGDLASYGIRGR